MHHVDISDVETPTPEHSLSLLSLFADNAKNTFFGGYSLFSSYQSRVINVTTGFFHTVLLPVSLTLGAGTKTIIDVATRQTMTNEEIETIKSQINGFDNLSFDRFIREISTYQPQSDASRELLASLHHDIVLAAAHLQEVCNEIETKIKLRVVEECKARVNPEDMKFLHLEPSQNFPFNHEQQLEIEHYMDTALTRYSAEVRQKQRKLIFDYLDNNLNTGKKLEHVIKDKATLILNHH